VRRGRFAIIGAVALGNGAAGLDDIRVVNLAGEIGQYCTKLLAHLSGESSNRAAGLLGESRPANDLLEEMLPVTARIQRTSIERVRVQVRHNLSPDARKCELNDIPGWVYERRISEVLSTSSRTYSIFR